MYRSTLFLLSVLLASTSMAAGVKESFEVHAETYADGVLLQANRTDVDLRVVVAGPDGAITTTDYMGTEPVFLQVNDLAQGAMADGLYKYEVSPVVSYPSPKQTQRMQEMRGLEDHGREQLAGVSGSFRVLNGVVLDPTRSEAETAPSQWGTQK